MPTLSTRADFQAALTAENRATRQLFKDMSADLIALVNRHADADGKIPPQDAEKVREQARALVAGYFVRERPVNGQDKQAEMQRLSELVVIAQRQMKTATKRQKAELQIRVSLLGKRINLLATKNVVIESIDSQGRGLSPYARDLVTDLRSVVHAAVDKQKQSVRKVVNRAKSG